MAAVFVLMAAVSAGCPERHIFVAQTLRPPRMAWCLNASRQSSFHQWAASMPLVECLAGSGPLLGARWQEAAAAAASSTASRQAGRQRGKARVRLLWVF